jgi:hypothetical protein
MKFVALLNLKINSSAAQPRRELPGKRAGVPFFAEWKKSDPPAITPLIQPFILKNGYI